MVSTTDVGITPRFALAAFDAVWVSNYVGSTISRIDPATGKVVSTIETASGPQLMLASGGRLWVSATDEPAVRSIDPTSDQVATTVDAGITPDGVAELDGGIWVASETGPDLHRIEPGTGDAAGPWTVADQGSISANQLVLADGATLWLPLFDEGDVVQVTPPGT